MNVDDTARAALQNLSELRRALFLERAGAPERQVLTALLGAARLYTGVDAKVALFVVDPGKQCLKFVVSDGLSQQDGQIIDDKPIRPESPPCGRAACLGEKVIVEDISCHPAAAGCLAFAQRQSIGACWSFPVRSQSREILGALIVYFSAPHRADSYRIELMEFVAECAALTMERYAEAEERRKAEAQLRESESRYRSLTNVLTSVLWTTDAEGRFTAPQHTWEKYTGQSWNDQQGFGWAQAIHPEDRERVREAVSRALKAGDFYRGDGRIWHQESQTYRYCEARGLPIRGEQGEIVEWIGTCVDVDDQRCAEEALRTADRRKDEFIAVLAHELRNPLAPIRNAVHILKAAGANDSKLSRAITIIDRQVAQMARLLDDLLDVSRISHNKPELRKTRLRLDSVLESALETSRPVLEQHGHVLELKLPAHPILVNGDATRLAQVFSNLLNNAAKYTERGGKVVLTARLDNDEAIVSVKDNGIGIEPDMLPNLFRMFSQASPALERAQGGLGIGLSLVRGLVDMHGGSVEAYSSGRDRGSEFVVRLPAMAGQLPAVPHAIAQSTRSDAQARSMRILVAEDNNDAAETLSVLLRAMGHEVRTATDGQEAVDIAAMFRPTAALLDIGMPKLNGYQAAQRIRALLPDVSLIATTGWGQDEDIRRAVAAGFNHHLVKPVDPDEVRELLGRLPPDTERATGQA